jgi:nicotinate phosphoribosyltransferase
LGGVYKLAAIQDSHGAWQPKVKLSEQAIKISNPGVLQVRRYRDSERFVADCIYDREFAPVPDPVLVDPADPLRQRKMEPGLDSEDLLTAVMKKGVRTGSSPALGALQAHAREQLKLLHPAIRRQKNPHGYPVGLEESLYRRKLELVQRGRRSSS